MDRLHLKFSTSIKLDLVASNNDVGNRLGLTSVLLEQNPDLVAAAPVENFLEGGRFDSRPLHQVDEQLNRFKVVRRFRREVRDRRRFTVAFRDEQLLEFVRQASEWKNELDQAAEVPLDPQCKRFVRVRIRSHDATCGRTSIDLVVRL